MNIPESKQLVKLLSSVGNRLAGALLFAGWAPALLVQQSVRRDSVTDADAAIGIASAAFFAVLALVFLVRGIASLRRWRMITAQPLSVSIEAGQWLEKRIYRTKKICVVRAIVGAFMVVPFVWCLITGSNFYRAQHPNVTDAYAGLFFFGGLLVFLLVGAVICALQLRRLRFEVDAQVKEPLIVARKGHLGRFVTVSLAAAVLAVLLMFQGTWYTQPYISTIPMVPHRQIPVAYDEETGVYTLRNPELGDFRILQLTDVHLGGSLASYSKDLAALETVYDLIERTRPDFIVVTGDFVFPLGIMSASFNNYTPMMQFCSFMRNIGIPWAMTYGNHDTEFVASHTPEQLQELFSQFSYQRTCTLMYTDVQPNVTGRSNQLLRLENADGSLNQLLYLIDSNSYTGNGINDYDYIHDDQVKWYEETLTATCEEEGRAVPSLIFTHIPVQEYQTAYDLYKAGDAAVTYYGGEVGEEGEAICCSDHPSALFDRAVELGSTQGIFCGHDHYNNISLEYEGIRLTYGMSIDYLAMPGIEKRTSQRGATLITLAEDGAMTVEQVPYVQE